MYLWMLILRILFCIQYHSFQLNIVVGHSENTPGKQNRFHLLRKYYQEYMVIRQYIMYCHLVKMYSTSLNQR